MKVAQEVEQPSADRSPTGLCVGRHSYSAGCFGLISLCHQCVNMWQVLRGEQRGVRRAVKLGTVYSVAGKKLSWFPSRLSAETCGSTENKL